MPSVVSSGQATGLVTGGTDTAQVGTDTTDGVMGGRHASSAQDVQTDAIPAETDATDGTDDLLGTDGNAQPYADAQAQAPTPQYDDATEPSAVAGGTPNDDAGFPQEDSQPVAEAGQTDGQDEDDRRKRHPGDEQDDDDDDDNGSGTGSMDGFCPLCHNHCPLTNPSCMRPRNAGLIS